MTKLEKFITKATPSNISKLSNKMLGKLVQYKKQSDEVMFSDTMGVPQGR